MILFKKIFAFQIFIQRFSNVTHRQLLVNRSSQNAKKTGILYEGTKQHGQNNSLGQRHWECSYCVNTTSTATTILYNNQDGRNPQSFGSGLGMRKTKNNLQTKWKPLLSFSCLNFSILIHSPKLSAILSPSHKWIIWEKEKYIRTIISSDQIFYNLQIIFFITANIKVLKTSLKTLSNY